MTLAHGTDRLESARLVLRRIAPDDLPFFTRIHALPEVAQYLYPGGRPRSPEESAAWSQATLASYEQLALGHLAVLRKEDGALIGRCGLTDLAVESAAAEHGIRRGWFGRAQAPAGVALTFECELGYTFDPAFWGQGFATEAVRCVRDYARDVLRLTYAVSVILPQNARSRRVAERLGVRAAGQLEVLGLTWDRYVWPLATGGLARLQPASTKYACPVLARAVALEAQQHPHEHAEHRARQRVVPRQQIAKTIRKTQHPLAHGHPAAAPRRRGGRRTPSCAVRRNSGRSPGPCGRRG
jgi:RimJ/RimL family protein N-acetyltransferase